MSDRIPKAHNSSGYPMLSQAINSKHWPQKNGDRPRKLVIDPNMVLPSGKLT